MVKRKTGDNSLMRLQMIDLLCIEFEDAWSRTPPPQLRNFLDEVPLEFRDSAIQELLWVEWDFLRRHSTPHSLDEYLNKYPRDRLAVQTAWEIDQNRIDGFNHFSVSRGNQYRIIRPHARGGLGQIYEANDEEVGRRVALKEVRREHHRDPAAHERLLREAKITGRLEHPGIVPVFSVGSNEDGNPFYAMRFVHGDSLLAAIEKFHDLPKSNAASQDDTYEALRRGTTKRPIHGQSAPASIPTAREKMSPGSYRSVEFRHLLSQFAYICRAIHYAHSQGVLHRDLKPSNIMLGEHGETLVVDWGLAKDMRNDGPEPVAVESKQKRNAIESYGTTRGTRLGTPGYASPEQTAGDLEDLQPTSDIYSLGATLFHLLTGEAPATGGMVRARRIQNAVPGPLEAICANALAANPDDRYSTAEALADEIENWMADQRVAAFSESVAARMARWARNHQATVMSALVGVLLIAVASVVVAAVANSRANEIENARQATIRKNVELVAAKKDAEQKRQTAEYERDLSEAIAKLMEEVFDAPSPDVDGRSVTVAELLGRKFVELKGAADIQPVTRMRLCLSIMKTFDSLNLVEEALSVGEFLRENPEFDSLGIEYQNKFWELWIANLVGDNQIDRARVEIESLMPSLSSNSAIASEERIDLRAVYAQALTYSGRPELALKSLDETRSVLKENAVPDDDQRWTTVRLESARALTRMVRHEEALDELQQICHHSDVQGFDVDLQIASAYSELNRHEESLELLQHCRLESESGFGLEHPITTRILDKLSVAYSQAGLLNKAIEASREVLTSVEKTYGPDSKISLAKRRDLARLYLHRGEPGDHEFAKTTLQEVLENLRREFGEHDATTLATREDLGHALINYFGDAEGLQHLEKSNQLSKLNFGATSRRAMFSSRMLAIGYRRVGRAQDAIDIYSDMLEHAEAIWSESSREMLGVRGNLATALVSVGRLEDATEIYAVICKQLISQQGYWEVNDWDTINNYLFTLRQSGRFDEQKECLDSISSRPEQSLGWGHSTTANFYKILAEAHKNADQYNQAQEVYQTLLKNVQRELGPDSVQSLDIDYSYSCFLTEVEGGHDPARILEAFERIEQVLGVTNLTTIRFRKSLAIDLVFFFKKFDVAEPHCQILAEVSAERPLTVEHAENLMILGICQLETDKFSQAAKSFREAASIRESLLPGTWKTAGTKSYLGEALIGCGQVEEGERLLVESFADFEKLDLEELLAGSVKAIPAAIERTVNFFADCGRDKEMQDFKSRGEQLMARLKNRESEN